MILRALVLSLLMLSFHSSSSQGQSYEFSFAGGQENITVPFSFTQGFIIINAKLNHKHKLKLILDTGAENIILFKYQSVLKFGLTVDKNIELVGSDLDKVVDAVICRRNKLQLDSGVATQNDLVVLKEDILALDQLIGEPIDGILGCRSFWGQVIEIDYLKQELTISKSKKETNYAHDLRYKAYPLKIENHKPYMEINYIDASDESHSLNVLVDTGSALGLLLFTHIENRFELPPRHIRAPLGKGIGGDIIGYIGLLPRVEFGKVLFINNVISYFQEIDEDIDPAIYGKRYGLIGNPLLSRFHVVIDYMNNMLYLKANHNFNKKIKYDLSGMQVFAAGPKLNDFVIYAVYDTSPAQEAGLKEGDVIKRLGFWGARWYSLSSLTNKLMRKEGKRLRVVVERDGKKMTKWLKLRDYLKE